MLGPGSVIGSLTDAFAACVYWPELMSNAPLMIARQIRQFEQSTPTKEHVDAPCRVVVRSEPHVKAFFENAQVDAHARACAGCSARLCTFPLRVRGRSSTR
jgi:hypothetical protein